MIIVRVARFGHHGLELISWWFVGTKPYIELPAGVNDQQVWRPGLHPSIVCG